MFEELKGFDSECGMRIQRVRRELMGEKLGNLCQMCNVAIIIVSVWQMGSLHPVWQSEVKWLVPPVG